MRLMRFDRPVGTLLLLWPTLAALWIAAAGRPSLALVVIFTLGTIVMRAAGCVINDYADRNLDAHVTRTRDRPMARKQVSEWEALALFAVLLAIALVLVLFLNDFTPENTYYLGLNPANMMIPGGGNPIATSPKVNLAIRTNTGNRVESVGFAEPGLYLVICNILPHFQDGMYAWVRVTGGGNN